jgi:hypothetical protein
VATSWIALQLTERPQFTCDHCLRAPASPPADLPFRIVESVLDQALGPDCCVLAGDKPPSVGGHPDGARVVSRVSDYCTRSSIIWRKACCRPTRVAMS